MAEFDLIARIRARAATRDDVHARHRRRCRAAAGAARPAAGRGDRHAQRRRAFPRRHRARRHRLEGARGESVRSRRDGRGAGVVHACRCRCPKPMQPGSMRFLDGFLAPGRAARRRAGRRRYHARAAVDLRDRAWVWSSRDAPCVAIGAGRRRGLGNRHARRCRGGAGAVAAMGAKFPSLRQRLDRPTPRVAAGGDWAAWRMRASMCPTACSPIWRTSARPAASARRSSSMRCRRRQTWHRVESMQALAACRRAAATTTSCASPPRRVTAS